jgi:hypothetical protein
VIIKQSLVVITFVEGVSGHFDSFGEVAERQVKNIDFVVSRSVIQHNVEVF